MSGGGALSDLVVLDLSHALAGPFCSTMLGDYGAEIIKIEPLEGEIARGWGPPFYGGESAYFVNLNRNKKSVAIDLKHPDGKALFFRLLERVGRRAREPARRHRRQARASTTSARASASRGIIYCSISGFGQDGPYRDRAALDLVVQAESGMMSITGEPGGRGVRAGVSIADITAGMYAAFGILAALHARQTTGRGQFIDVSMLEGQLGILSGMIGAYRRRRHRAGAARHGLRRAAALPDVPDEDARHRDRHRQRQAVADVLPAARPAGTEPTTRAMSTNAARNANRPSLIATLQDAFLTKSYEEWEAILLPAGVPMGAINTLDVGRRAPAGGRARRAGRVDASGGRRGADDGAAGADVRDARVGAHAGAAARASTLTEVLRERLALSDEEIARLRRAGVIKN